MGAPIGPTGVNDRAARLLLTPLLGVAIPIVAGLVDYGSQALASALASYAWFIGLSWLTWEGNLRLYLRFQDRTAWLTRPWHRVRLLVGLICLFTIPLVVSALWGWAWLFGGPSLSWRSLALAVALIVAAVVFITHVYETVFLVREWESDRMRNERLQRENVEAELAALKSEVQPHTLFNNLNALAHMVDTGDPRAPAFVSTLAASYRHLLRSRRARLIGLDEEIELLQQFTSLMEVRYGPALQVAVDVDPVSSRRWRLPPVVLPELLENAAKHNELSAAEPLAIEVRLEGDRLTVSHERRPRAGEVPSTGVGLHNLAQRFRLTTGVAARWAEGGGRFVVTLPLVAADGANVAE